MKSNKQARSKFYTGPTPDKDKGYTECGPRKVSHFYDNSKNCFRTSVELACSFSDECLTTWLKAIHFT